MRPIFVLTSYPDLLLYIYQKAKNMNASFIFTLKQAADQRVKEGQRPGQALMNALYSLNVELYNEIVGTEADCFYRDSVTSVFYQRIAEKTC